MRLLVRLSLLGALISVSLAATQAHAECKLDAISELPITIRGGQALIAAKVNGVAEQFAVDSGAFSNMMTPNGAVRAGVPLHPGPAFLDVYGVGGRVEVRIGTVKDFQMGNVPIPDLDFLVAGTVGDGADGLIGQTVLRVVDVEYDFAHNKMRLFKPNGCGEASLAYWAKDEGVGIVPLEPQSPLSLYYLGSGLQAKCHLTPYAVGAAHVNGGRIRALFDTGAATSTLTTAAAQRLGVRIQGEGVRNGGLVVGVDHRGTQSWIAPVEAFEIGGEQIKNTHLRVSAGGAAGLDEPDMLLGFDFFMSHRVYVSNSQHKIYFTYAGGPVFNLTTTREPASAAPGAPSGGAEAPK